MEHLIADSGIHFITTELELNPSEPLVLPSGKALKYSFCQTQDPILGTRIFDMLVFHPESESFVPLGEIISERVFRQLPDGSDELDPSGLPILRKDFSSSFCTAFKADSPEVVTINSPASLRRKVSTPEVGVEMKSALELLLGKWLPMPMFERPTGGNTLDKPIGWCRVRIEECGEGSGKGMRRYRLNWAFDTTTAKSPDDPFSPYFYEGEEVKKNFALCNYAYSLIGFLNSDPRGFTGFSEYIAALLDIDPDQDGNAYIAYYIYLINYLRLSGAAPEIALYNPAHDKDIPVDLVLDIGNSRTCGVLFEEGDFTRAMMLGLRDLSHPERIYSEPFDMRLAFRTPDLGRDIYMGEKDLFSWQSFVRLGREASSLIFRTLEEDGLSQRSTNHSSPKRYLWDDRPIEGKWECIVTDTDPSSVALAPNVYIPELSPLFDHVGNYLGRIPAEQRPFDLEAPAYSRRSLMTFVLIEIFRHALVQINSPEFRSKHGDIDLRRVLRRVILTCPTAMPVKEQIALRQAAADAFDAVSKSLDVAPAEVIPSVESLTAGDSFDVSRRSWSYDEASCAQLVYLYAEIAQRYAGEVGKFFELKGHVRPELAAEGYDRKALTVGTVDIGAGTTDIMICTYRHDGGEKATLTPVPLFWDSFYIAGDDALRAIVQNQVIEGRDMDTPDLGNITSALRGRLRAMGAGEIAAIPGVAGNPVFAAMAKDIDRAADPADNERRRDRMAANLVHAFFGRNSAMMSYTDRRCRTDFNTQVSLPLSQFFMEQLRRGNPARVFSYEEIFDENRPAPYLLDYFARHFGFRFEELSWRFDPEETARIVKTSLEPLLRQLAVVLHAYNCDVLVLAGRPTSIDAVTDLFVKYLPLSPDRLVRLNTYRVGQWFPFSDAQGYFYDQKAVVAVGAMVGHLAHHDCFGGMRLDFTEMKKRMTSTARYMGLYSTRRQIIQENLLSPSCSTTTIEVSDFPAFLGCKQFASAQYQARPIYGIFSRAGHKPLRITLSRNYFEDRETLQVEDVADLEGNTLPKTTVDLRQMSLADDGRYWLDHGEFDLSII